MGKYDGLFHEKKCECCGKPIIRMSFYDYAYTLQKHGKTVYYCSWGCLRKSETRKKSEKPTKLNIGDTVKFPYNKLNFIVVARDDRYIIVRKDTTSKDNQYRIIDLVTARIFKETRPNVKRYATEERCQERLRAIERGEVEFADECEMLELNII